MSLLGKTIRLKGKTQKGKNRVSELGDLWSVMAETDAVLFAPSSKGPWMHIVPFGRSHDDKASRWIHGLNDLDFEIVQ